MDKKNLTILLLILAGGIVLSQYVEPPHREESRQEVPFKDSSLINTSNNKSTKTIQKEVITCPQSFADIIEKIEPALVNISAVHIIEIQSPFYQFYYGDPFEDFFDNFFGRSRRRETPKPEMRRERQEGTGSGFIVDADGYILTNQHVIRKAEELKVTTYDGQTYDAKLIGQDSRTDLAVIKIKSRRKFHPVMLGNSDEIKIGDWVLAAGSPFGLNQTFTAGIISALRQDVEVEQNRYRNILQTDAAINRGNSGGPLVNLEGEVVGINTAIYAPTGVFAGVGFAIPVNDARQVLTELIEKGHVVRGWLGVEISDVDGAIQRQFKLDTEKGVLVNRVIKNSPAGEGGLLRGDVINSLNGEEVEDTRALQQKVGSAKPGAKIKIGIVRKGEKKVIDITLGEMPDEFPEISSKEKESAYPEKESASAEWLGIKAANITPAVSERYNINQEKGVAVLDIDPASEGYEIGLRVGDIIVGLNNKEISNAEDFKSAGENASLKEGVVFDIIRRGRPLFISYQKAR